MSIGSAPVFAPDIYTTLGRKYFYSISFFTDPGGPSGQDSDDDGLPDNWELAYAPNLNALSQSGDFDHDGTSDTAERIAGTNPFDAGSRFQLREVLPQPGGQGVSARFDSVPGRTYRIDVSTDLANWTDMGTLESEDWPATQTHFTMDATSLPPGGLQKLFVRAAAER